MQCMPKQFANTNILSETADGMKSFCIGKWVNETGEGTTFILQGGSSIPPPAKINCRRKSKRAYSLALDIPMDSKENRSQELLLNQMKPMNCMSTTNIFQSEMASVKFSVQETIGPCHKKLGKTADVGSEFCETTPLSQITNNKVKKGDRKEDNLLLQGLDSGFVQAWHTLKHEKVHHDLLPDPSNETDIYSISPSMTILKKIKTGNTTKIVSICFPCANTSGSSEALFSDVDSMKNGGNLSQFEQHNASSCNPRDGCELTETSRQDDNQEHQMWKNLEKCSFLELQLSREFALRPVMLFGSSDIDSEFLCTEDYKAHLDKKVAKMIHSQWKKSVEERLKQISLMDPNTLKVSCFGLLKAGLRIID
ncbi:uncharacterized protein LOC119977902 isoform X2 [Scyliorhinus canicula]|uniref:uncharacterized protein LOC119977902 isoform X2 n=1 Tax=Scyliorhinus canicula TaxID=7830 RepID=UPI0018F3C69C|nr:uncharacterized protein LOC119977902 isoform X2 [Scyliorhinus canicula]